MNNDPKNQNKGGKNRDWGYASYYDDKDDNTKLIYTSYEKNGSVNRYTENDDNGHGHEHWNSHDSYNAGDSADWGRSESNSSGNPDTGEVQDNGGCYLTGACMHHYQSNFNDNCHELQILRWFRDNKVSLIDKLYYYKVAPSIVKSIEDSPIKEKIYHYIYKQVINPCVLAIENGNYKFAYRKYKENVQWLKNYFEKQQQFKIIDRAKEQTQKTEYNIN